MNRDPSQRKANSKAGDDPGLVLMSEVDPRPIEWYWPGYLPFGKVVIFEGEPDVGKSLVTCDLAARASRGRPLPDQSIGPACAVLMICAEDDVEDTIQPRLAAARADLDVIAYLRLERDAEGTVIPLTLPDDIPRIERAVRQLERRTRRKRTIVIIDPVMAYLNERIDTHKDASSRRATTPLADLATRLRCLIILVRHLNKNSREVNAKNRGSGSTAWGAAARAVFLFANHPTQNGRRVMARVKGNLAQSVPAQTYKIVGSRNDPDQPRIAWTGRTRLAADDLLARPDARRAAPERDRAMAQLDELLKATPDGQLPVAQVREHFKGSDLSWETVRAAKKELGLVSDRVRLPDGTTAGWIWRRPASVRTPRPPAADS